MLKYCDLQEVCTFLLQLEPEDFAFAELPSCYDQNFVAILLARNMIKFNWLTRCAAPHDGMHKSRRRLIMWKSIVVVWAI